MAIPSQQIGWSQRAKLLWNISKQLENLIKVAGNVQLTTTSTTTTVVPTTTTTTTQTIYTIGQAALGGIIAYINDGGTSGTSGLVVTAANLSNAEWGCNGTELTGADGVVIGTGNQNTIDIMAGCLDAGIAARSCGDLTEGGYSDWYLPSKNELNALYINRNAIGGFPTSSNSIYHSSTEHNINSNWSQDFSDGAQYTFGKSNLFFVRAVRSF